MSNNNCLEGMKCPKCEALEPFRIVATLSVLVYDDGTQDDPMSGHTEWGDNSPCSCDSCQHAGKVSDFKTTKEG